MTTEWAPVPGWEHAYCVSDDGMVRSLSRVITFSDGRTRRQPEVILRSRLSNGYPVVDLKHNRVRRTVRVHRLVLEAFVGACPDGQECLHRNGDSTDIRLTNLRWGTPSENKADSVTHGTHRNSRKTKCVKGHEFTPENTWTYPGHKPGQWQCVCRTCHYERRARI